MTEYRGTLHQPSNPAPDPTVRSHCRVQFGKAVTWREAGRWRTGRVGYADTTKAEVWPDEDGGDRHIRVWVGAELDDEGLRVKPVPPKLSRHEV